MKTVTKYFGDIVESVYAHVGAEAQHVTTQILEELYNGTPATTGSGTPVDKGYLKSSWRAGIRPNSRPAPESPILTKPMEIKKYGVHYRYYIWNNTPYIGYVNDGIAGKAGTTSLSAVNTNFIPYAINKGILNAQKMTGAFNKIKKMKHFNG